MSSSSSEAPRCRHIKGNGTQCGSPSLRSKYFCFYHEQHRPLFAECYAAEKYSTGDIVLPAFEDAHSIQFVIRKTVQLLLQKRIEGKTASLLLYALQIASSNLKRMELEKPQPEQVVLDTVIHEKWESPIAPMQEAMPEKEPEKEKEKVKENEKESQAKEASATAQQDSEPISKEDEADLPPGTIQACYQPPDHSKDKSKDKKDARRSRGVPSAGQSTNWWDMSVSKRIH